MSVDQIAGFTQLHHSHGQRFILPFPGDMSNRLTMGQIIKSKVLRHVEGNRYATQIGREEKIIDSSVPLRTGDLLYGRVVGLGEHVELERLHIPQAMPSSLLDVPTRIASDVFSRAIAEQVLQLFTEYGADLNERDASILNHVLRASPAIEPAIYAGLVLTKLGLPFTPEKLDALTRTLTADPNLPLFDERLAIYLSAQPNEAIKATNPQNDSERDANFARSLADIADSSARNSTLNNAAGDGGQEGDSGTGHERGLAYQLLNLQVEGAMGHRVATVPLVIDGELIELNIGLVDQREAREDQTTTAHRRLVFTLNTDVLGTVGVDGTLTGEHIQLRFHVEHAGALDVLQSHSDSLQEALRQSGFVVDAIHHEVATRQDMPSAAWLVAKSVVQNDSLDKWI